MASFVDRLIALVQERGGKPDFGRCLKGCSEEEIRELERCFGGPIPSEFREYLARMGKTPLKFIADDMGPAPTVFDVYRKPESADMPPPRGESILVDVGFECDLFLDGSKPGLRPVMFRSGRPELYPVADSFESLCMKVAWIDFIASRFKSFDARDFSANRPGAIEAAAREAESAGLRLETFSDSVSRLLTGPKAAVHLRLRNETWEVLAQADDPEDAARLAEKIAEASGAKLPLRPRQVS